MAHLEFHFDHDLYDNYPDIKMNLWEHFQTGYYSGYIIIAAVLDIMR